MQPGPVKYLDVIRVQVETLRQQRSQLLGSAYMFQRMPQFNYTAPFVGIGRCVSLGPCCYEVRVVLGSHDYRLFRVRRGRP